MPLQDSAVRELTATAMQHDRVAAPVGARWAPMGNLGGRPLRMNRRSVAPLPACDKWVRCFGIATVDEVLKGTGEGGKAEGLSCEC